MRTLSRLDLAAVRAGRARRRRRRSSRSGGSSTRSTSPPSTSSGCPAARRGDRPRRARGSARRRARRDGRGRRSRRPPSAPPESSRSCTNGEARSSGCGSPASGSRRGSRRGRSRRPRTTTGPARPLLAFLLALFGAIAFVGGRRDGRLAGVDRRDGRRRRVGRRLPAVEACAAAASRASDFSLPSSSRLSNRPGEIFEPVIASRIG